MLGGTLAQVEGRQGSGFENVELGAISEEKFIISSMSNKQAFLSSFLKDEKGAFMAK